MLPNLGPSSPWVDRPRIPALGTSIYKTLGHKGKIPLSLSINGTRKEDLECSDFPWEPVVRETRLRGSEVSTGTGNPRSSRGWKRWRKGRERFDLRTGPGNRVEVR